MILKKILKENKGEINVENSDGLRNKIGTHQES